MSNPTMPPDRYAADAATMTALFDTLGAVVIALSDTMPPPHRAHFAANLARLAKNAEARGNPLLETALLDMWRAATPPR